MDNYVINTLGFDSRARIIFSESTNMIHELQDSFNIEANIGQALIELIATICLLSGPLDNKQRISVKLTGDASNKFMTASAEAAGGVRGFANDGFIQKDLHHKSSKGVFGNKGVVTVQRDSGMFDNYTGVTEMKYGNISKNIEHYYKQSEQLPTFIRLFIAYDKDNRVIVSRGLMFQLLPGGPKTLINEFVKALNTRLQIFNTSDARIDFNTLNSELPVGLKFMSVKPLAYRCGCTKEQYYGLIFSLLPNEIDEIISQKQTLKAPCSVCGKIYLFNAAEIARLFGLPEPE